MSRLKLRWALVRVALIMCIILAVQFFSQLGLLNARPPNCEQIKVFKERLSVQANPGNEQVIAIQKDDPIIEKPVTKQDFKNDIKNEQSNMDIEKLISDLKRIAVELSETHRGLANSAAHYHRVGKSLQSLNSVIQSLGGQAVDDKEHSLGDKKADAPKKEVCPEKFLGRNLAYGYPYFRKGFGRINCTEFVPMNRLVTILVTLPEELPAKDKYKVFEGIAKHYSDVQVVYASQGQLSKDTMTKLKLNLKHHVSTNLNHGETWSKLLDEVSTPYVLFAPEITHFTDDIDLERLIRVLSDNKEAIIAGGSHRNLKGQWDIGCLQLTFRNWTAYFRGGYYHSFTECVVCDVLSGPFVAKTEQLKQVSFDGKLPFGVFQDLFWRLKMKHPGKIVISCPDVMFNIYDRDITDDKYAALARKWEVKKWVDSSGKVRWYGCRRGHSYTGTSSCGFHRGLGVPPCDLENLADAIKFVMKECEDAGLFCELQEGTLLGAVKFNKVLPWERDADITFLTGNYSAFKKLRSKFQAAGYSLSDDDGSLWCCADGRQAGGKFRIGTTRWTLELYGQHIMESETLVANGQRPTKVQFSGQWVTVMRNPGLFARNRYGPGIYRHQEHWMDIGHGTGWAFYNPGSFSTCAQPGHSGCLDKFSSDGNLQFSDYPFV